MPERKMTGTKSAASTRVVAMIGLVTWPMVRSVASRTSSSLSRISRWMFSSTMMASSTTRLMASTMANRVMVLAE
ncbi:hypothetical protein FQZ97_728060 [compost metagenome]